MEPSVLAEQLRLLSEAYPSVTTALEFRTPFELLVATVLAAQCTDLRVNSVTPALFTEFGTPAAMAGAPVVRVEELVSSVTFFRSKARNLVALSAQLLARHGGTVPSDLEDLLALPGVGRKTAQVVQGYAFGLPALAVDTHTLRLAGRLGWTERTDPVGVERDLRSLLPKGEWALVHQRLVHHGRALCTAHRPRCGECPLRPVCPSAS